jgi:hypothetical protein
MVLMKSFDETFDEKFPFDKPYKKDIECGLPGYWFIYSSHT